MFRKLFTKLFKKYEVQTVFRNKGMKTPKVVDAVPFVRLKNAREIAGLLHHFRPSTDYTYRIINKQGKVVL